MLLGTRYRIEAALASGAMGAVWRARDERLHGRLCAVKSLLLEPSTPEDERERIAWFQREMAMLSQLNHPAICNILDVVSEPGNIHHMVMEFVDGKTLAQHVAERGNPGIDEATVLTWARELTDALAYLHAHVPPVIFRDLKPSNVMLRPDGHLTLIDFGIARFREAATGTAIGTGGYAAPEQYQGLASPQSDVFALSATLHHLLTGRNPQLCPPFTFPLVRVLAPAVSVACEAAIERALTMRPADRYASVTEFLHAIEGGVPAPVPAPSAGQQPAAPLRSALPHYDPATQRVLQRHSPRAVSRSSASIQSVHWAPFPPTT